MTQTADLQSKIGNPKSAISSPLSWAVFLACSWTWCIGMYLPVLLVRDYGVWGWVVFAVPNVIGAAAMGWVLRDWMRSVRIMAAHAHACIAFSLVTVAFQVYFLEWWVRPLGGWTYAVVALAVLVALVLAVPTWGSLVAGCATFAFSVVVAVLFLSSHPPPPPAVTTHAAW